MSNNKPSSSSIDWLISQLQKSKDWHRVLNEVSQMSSARIDILEQAKAMHKEELEFAFKGGMNLVEGEGHLWKPIDKFEEFYNETFVEVTMSNNKQSSVEYYINNLIDILGDEICNKLTIEQTNRIHFLGKQAKAMHKKENSQTWFHCLIENEFITFEDYYNLTFGGEDEQQ